MIPAGWLVPFADSLAGLPGRQHPFEFGAAMIHPIESVTQLDAKKKAYSLFEEFKNFAFKGNVIDLAVGVIIGAAFGKIVDSLVKNVIMPTIAVIIPGNQGYVDWKATINGKDIPYGLFLGEVVNFLIVAFALYIFIVKFLGLVLRNKKTAEPPPPTKQELLLMEIRDLLKANAPPAPAAAPSTPQA
jgi:large conductance mechanosensitive channel